MKVVDIHPEDLIDKLHDGALTVAERQRLDLHLAQCSVCRFEIATRADLAHDAPAIEHRPQLTFSPGAGDAPLPLREAAPPRVSPSIRTRSRRRWPLGMLAAALVLSAGGAMAAVMTGAVGTRWLGWSPPPKPALVQPQPGSSKLAPKAKRAVAMPSTASPQSEPVTSSAAPSPSLLSPPSRLTEAPAAPRAVVAVTPAPRASARHSELEQANSENARAALASSLPHVSPAAGSAEGSAPRVDASTLFADANRARRDGNVERAVSLYRTLQSRYPSSSESELSRALLAQLLLDHGNPEAALAGFDRYLADGVPVLSAEALVGRARALERLGKLAQAAAAWRQVQSRFPGSVHARLAETRLAALGTR